MIKNRVRELRKQRGLTLDQLAELTGISTGHLSRIERHEKGWSMESLPKIAKALGIDAHHLIDASEAWQEVPVIGTVGQATLGRILSPENGAESARMRVKVPAVLGDVIAISVVGSSLYPRYNTGDVIIASEPSVDPASAGGKECILVTSDQRVAVKFLQTAPGSATVVATSHNEPPQADMNISRCYPVVYVVR